MSEQFENIIRKKLQEAEPSFDPSAWDQMKKKLDDADRRRPFFWWWAGGLLLILGLGGWWWFAGTPAMNNPAGKNHTITRNEFSKNTPADATNFQTSSNGGNAQTQGTTTPANVNNPQNPSSSVPGNTGTPGNLHNQSTSSSSETGNTPPPAATPANVHNPVIANPLPAVIPTTPANVDNPAQKTSDSTENKEDQKEKRPAKKQKRGFDGGLFLGPDFNATRSFKGVPIGVTGGLIVRYHVNNRWYLSSGVGYAKKLYGATPSEYSTSYPATFYAIDADCDVIDIPLSVNYTFAQGKTSSWSAMAGASSYFMLKERYEYYYPNDVKYTREYNNQNQHYFSVINLGVTWEKQTRSRLSWGLQPYVKIPVGGVGQGKVRVYSAGITVQAILGKKKD